MFDDAPRDSISPFFLVFFITLGTLAFVVGCSVRQCCLSDLSSIGWWGQARVSLELEGGVNAIRLII